MHCIAIDVAGGGGWGDPFDRAPEKVVQDVLDEKISRESALRDYGVVMKKDGGLEPDETRRLRSARRAAE